MTATMILEVARTWLGSLRSWTSSIAPAILMRRSLRNIALCCLQTRRAQLLTKRMTKSVYHRRSGSDQRDPHRSNDRPCGRVRPKLAPAVDGLVHRAKG